MRDRQETNYSFHNNGSHVWQTLRAHPIHPQRITRDNYTMNTNDRNTSSQYIEKFSGDFGKEDHGCSIIINQTMNNIRDLDAAGMYAYLSCRPESWKINAKHLKEHFKCGKDKIYSTLNKLIELGLLTVHHKRDKGKFTKPFYMLHTKPVSLPSQQSQASSPCPEKPDADKPDTENTDTYKTKKLENKEIKTTTTSIFSEETDKQLLALRDKHLPPDERTDEEFLKQCKWHVDNGNSKFIMAQRIKGLKTLLTNGYFDTPSTYPKQKQSNGISEQRLRDSYGMFYHSWVEQDLRSKGYVTKSFEEWVKSNA